MTRKETLQQAIDRFSKLYYYTGTPAATDQQFDSLLAELASIDPNDERVTRVGFPAPQDTMLTKVKHRVRTNSLSKAENEGDLRKWHTGVGKGPIMVEQKLDGLTIVLYYVDGVLDLAATRGGDDGIGEDVTRNASKFKNIPHRLPIQFTGGVRGEALITREDFPKVDPTLAGNERNIGNGIVRRTDGTQSEYISFFAFNFEDLGDDPLHPETESEKLGILKSWGFTPVEHRLCNDADGAIQYWRETDARRKANQLATKIDGLVFIAEDTATQEAAGFVSGRPKGAIVLKFEAPGAITKVNGVVITLGHTGVIKPTASLDPVVIDNTTVKSAQLNNWDIIEAMGVTIGSIVIVQKAQDIVPQLVQVVERPDGVQTIPRPTECPVCHGPVGRRIMVDGTEGVEIECKNPDCEGKSLKRIQNWITKNNILGIGDTLLAAIVEAFDMKSPADLYRLEVNKLAALIIGNGEYGMSRAQMVYDNIQNSRKMDINHFMGSLGIRHLGRRRVQLIREKCPGEMDTVADWRSDKLNSLDAGVTNMVGEITEDVAKYSDVIDDLLKYIEIISDEPKATTQSSISGKSFCFTGVRLHDELLAKFNEVGAIEKSGISKGLDYLVAKDTSGSSSKLEKARKLGVKVISLDEFKELLG